MSLRKSLIFLLATAIITLAIVFRSELIDLLIRPVSLLLWEVWRMLLGIDQLVYWSLLVLSGLIVFSQMLLKGLHSPKPRYYADALPNLDRIEYWRGRINTTAGERSGANLVMDELVDLQATYIRLQSARKPDQKKAMGKEQIERVNQFTDSNVPDDNAIVQILPGSIRKWFATRNSKKLIKSNLPIVEWLEKELEVKHDN